MKKLETTNYKMLKIAMKRGTAFTFSDWIRMQYLLVNRLYVHTYIRTFEPAAPYYREVNLLPIRHNPMGTKVV